MHVAPTTRAFPEVCRVNRRPSATRIASQNFHASPQPIAIKQLTPAPPSTPRPEYCVTNSRQPRPRLFICDTLKFPRVPARVSEALVLRTYPFKEADLVVSFLTRDQGKLRGVAKRARRPKSTFGSGLERLSHVRMAYFQRESHELVNLDSCELIRSQFDLASDYQASIALDFFAEATDLLLALRGGQRKVFPPPGGGPGILTLAAAGGSPGSSGLARRHVLFALGGAALGLVAGIARLSQLRQHAGRPGITRAGVLQPRAGRPDLRPLPAAAGRRQYLGIEPGIQGDREPDSAPTGGAVGRAVLGRKPPPPTSGVSWCSRWSHTRNGA